METVSGKQVGRYEIRSRIGSGGMGEVYLARDPLLDREVAIKMLPLHAARNDGVMERFVREARAASALNHPNIVTIHEISEVDSRPFIVMEHIAGRTLRAIIDERFGVATLMQFGVQIARALSAAHELGITHRDIKPENIMVRHDGIVKLLDFGVARLSPVHAESGEAETLAMTAPGMLVGTARYMSPEQAEGGPVRSASDIFSLGLVFYETVTGRHPFAAGSMIGMLQAIMIETPLPPSQFNPEIPDELDELILQMLEKEALLRPSAGEVARALSELSEPQRKADKVPTHSPRQTVGRELELAQLRDSAATVTSGQVLLWCLTGEPGIGKTTLMEELVSELAASSENWNVGRGRCSERLAGTEAYLPWLEALDSLLRHSRGQFLAETMKTLAPTWFLQIQPVSAEEDSLAGRLASAQSSPSPERLKRELSSFLQAISRRNPLVLCFDDLQWADVSTVDLLSYLALKSSGMRLLIIATYRPAILQLAKHPFLSLKSDLQARGVCREMSLDFLSVEEIEKYLDLQFPKNRFPAELPRLIHSRTEGSPLFMADLVRYLRDRKVIMPEGNEWVLAGSLPEIREDLPESMRGMIERKIVQLSDDQRHLLTAAGVQGFEFDSAVIARALQADVVEVEEHLHALERVHAFVRLVEEREFPDHSLTLRYRFVHVLYQNQLYGSLTPTRRAKLSAEVAQSLLECFGEHSSLVAHNLAFLFEAARDFAQAAAYFLAAAQNAARVFSWQEAEMLASHGLQLLDKVPTTPERTRRELDLQTALGSASLAAKGFAAPEAREAYARALELCDEVGETPNLFRVLWGLWQFWGLVGEEEISHELADQMLSIAQNADDPALLLVAQYSLGSTLHWAGEFPKALDHQQKSGEIYHAAHHRSLAFLYGGYDLGVASRAFASHTLWYLGYPDRALKSSAEANELARELKHPPFSLAHAMDFTGWLHQYRREPQLTLHWAERCIPFAREHGLRFFVAHQMVLSGWARAMQGCLDEGIRLILEGIDAYRATGAELERVHWLALLADVYLKARQPDEGLAAIAEAMTHVRRFGFDFNRAELWRLKGELLLMKANASEDPFRSAGICFHTALEISRRQQARSLELRAANSLARLYQQQGRHGQACDVLTPVFSWFTEGFETADLRQARELLEVLSTPEEILA